ARDPGRSPWASPTAPARRRPSPRHSRRRRVRRSRRPSARTCAASRRAPCSGWRQTPPSSPCRASSAPPIACWASLAPSLGGGALRLRGAEIVDADARQLDLAAAFAGDDRHHLLGEELHLVLDLAAREAAELEPGEEREVLVTALGLHLHDL